MSKLRLLRLSGDQDIRVQDIRRKGEQGIKRMGNLELRMDSVSKPALSKKKPALKKP